MSIFMLEICVYFLRCVSMNGEIFLNSKPKKKWTEISFEFDREKQAQILRYFTVFVFSLLFSAWNNICNMIYWMWCICAVEFSYYFDMFVWLCVSLFIVYTVSRFCNFIRLNKKKLTLTWMHDNNKNIIYFLFQVIYIRFDVSFQLQNIHFNKNVRRFVWFKWVSVFFFWSFK